MLEHAETDRLQLRSVVVWLRAGATSRERIEGCQKTHSALSLQNKILNVDVLLKLGRGLLNSIPGVFLSRRLNRSMKETAVPLSLLCLRVLLGLKEGCLLLLDVLYPGEVNRLQGHLDLSTPWSWRHHRILL